MVASAAAQSPNPTANDAGRTLLYVVNVSWFFLSHRLPLAIEAQRRGYVVHLATQIASSQDLQQLNACGIHVHEIAVVRGSLSPIADARLVIDLFNLYRRIRPALVHLVTLKLVLLGGLAARLAKVPAVIAAISGLGYSFTTGGIRSTVRRWLLQRGLRTVCRHRNICVIFQNAENRSHLLRAGAVAEQQAVLIRGSGVDCSKFHETAEPIGVVRVLLASRMLREKGIEEFIRAARALRESVGNVCFTLAGAVDTENPGGIAQDQLERWHASGDIEWLGHCEDMPLLLANSNIVCLPSYYGEGVPKILLEAAAAGRAIVTTNTPGCRDVVHDGVNGLLVPPRDSTALTAALSALIHDPALRARLGAKGRERALTEFEIAGVVADTMRVYTRVAGDQTQASTTARTDGHRLQI